MKAIVVQAYGGPEQLGETEVPTPEPGPGQVLVRLGASGVNFVDVYHRSGHYQLPLPLIPGSEGAGTVTALGPGVTDVAIGQRIGWASLPGSYAEYAVLPADRVVPLPD